MKCIVTGGAGFIGSNLVDKLLEDGHEVIIIDNLSTGSNKNINHNAKFLSADIANPHVLKNIKSFKAIREEMNAITPVTRLNFIKLCYSNRVINV